VALRVAIPSYFSQKSFERDGSFVPQDGAARFDAGWLTPPMLAGLAAALEEAPDWRFDRAAEMAAHCRTVLAQQFELVGDPPQGTLVSFVGPGDPAEDAIRLYSRGVVIRDLPGTGRLRASCGWWTNEEDVERLASELSAVDQPLGA
jgi:L-cysteine/cystine lyase